MKLIIQPEDGVQPLIEAIDSARKEIRIAIFRFDHREIEQALVQAARRGVTVHALIAFTNRGGEVWLRALELRLLAAGALVGRSNNDLARYHAKYLIIDGRKLFVLGFNFTREDLRNTRSLGFVTSKPKLVSEAIKLFSADCQRQGYSCGSNNLIVSPVNAREALSRLIGTAKKELLIYDSDLSDPAMLQILLARASRGVHVRIIGGVKARETPLDVRCSHPLRLHVRAIVRDRDAVFLGSQSLRRLDLDARRELGVLIRDRSMASRVAGIFDLDWESAQLESVPAEKVARKVAKAVAKQLGPIAPVLEEVVATNGGAIAVDPVELDVAVKDAVKAAVRETLQEAFAQPATKE